jgi:hypothetical protein
MLPNNQVHAEVAAAAACRGQAPGIPARSRHSQVCKWPPLAPASMGAARSELSGISLPAVYSGAVRIMLP